MGDFYSFDPDALRWTNLMTSSNPGARYDFGMISASNMIYVFGGKPAEGDQRSLRANVDQHLRC